MGKSTPWPTTTSSPTTHDRSRLRSVEEVAERLNVDPQTVRRLALKGEIRFIRVGRNFRFTDAWIDQFIERQR